LQRQLGNVSVPGVFEVLPKTDTNPLAGSEPKEYNPDKKVSSFLDVLTSGLTQEDVDKVAKVEGVSSAEPFYTASAEYVTRAGQKKFQAPQVQQDFGLNLDLSAGRLLKKSDTSSVVLPDGYLASLGFSKAEDAVGSTVTLAYKNLRTQKVIERKLTVQGVMRKTFITQDTLFVTLDAAKDLAAAQGQDTKFLAVIATFKDATDQTDESVLRARLQNAGNYTAVSIKQRISTVTTVVSAITAGLNMVGIIALLAASFGIINTLLMSVYERTQEIGLMKALGMRRKKVFALFAIEAVLVGFWGSVVAVGAATLASMAVNNWASSSFLKDFEGLRYW
jgi:putative ABC transport system permease protein